MDWWVNQEAERLCHKLKSVKLIYVSFSRQKNKLRGINISWISFYKLEKCRSKLYAQLYYNKIELHCHYVTRHWVPICAFFNHKNMIKLNYNLQTNSCFTEDKKKKKRGRKKKSAKHFKLKLLMVISAKMPMPWRGPSEE